MELDSLSTSLVYLTVWAALVCYLAGPAATACTRTAARSALRWTWTVGSLLFLIHAISAFAIIYGWNFQIAWAETARQSQEFAGFDSGIGLVLNIVFTGVWLVDAGLWWARPERYLMRSHRKVLLVHGFFLFMIVNGAVIFVPGPQRFLGVLIVALALFALWRGLSNTVPASDI